MPSRVKKESGILLPLFSLGGGHGIGDLGPESYRFGRFLKAAGQRYWQLLPLCPVDAFGSPYKSSSAFAGEILYISIDFLVRDRFISAEDLPNVKNLNFVDYQKVREIKMPLLQKAADNFNVKSTAYRDFCKKNKFWLDDYALFCAAGGNIENMDEKIKYKIPYNINEFKKENRKKIEFFKITQYLFYKQFFELKSYLNGLGIKLIGDMPFYVSAESADVWATPDNFLLNTDFSPALISGVPPDNFAHEGQVWGNPIYNFNFQKNDGYSFFEKRFYHGFCMYDILRIDHFSGFARYYCIDAEKKDAKNGVWKSGVGEDLFITLKELLRDKAVIAEDLGGEKDEAVQKLIKKFNIPNMKVLQFGFTGEKNNPFLPVNYPFNCIAYTGTHDNPTALGYYESAEKKERVQIDCLANAPELPPSYRMIRLIMKSNAKLCIVPLFDYMCLNNTARINTPGTEGGNWSFRISRISLSEFLAEEIKDTSKR